ncbi:MAG: sugar phosphate isomerase/epimerase [Armatimonadota bacterium]|nr:sugar phosphate isomerase/epimerase [Armatimonadota bacterium]
MSAMRLGFNVASLPNRPLEEAARLGAELGLEGVELLGFEGYRHSQGDLPGVWLDELDDAGREELAGLLAPFEDVSVHAPFWEVAPFSVNSALRRASREQLRATVRGAAGLGASTITTHVIPRPGYELAEYRQDVLELYRELGDLAGELGCAVTVETGFPPGVEAFAALIRDIDHPAVGATVDVGHLRALLSEDERRPEAIGEAYNALVWRHVRSLRGRISHVHLHDVRAEGLRDHRECGTGVIDYPALMRELLAAQYQGMLSFELEESDDLAALGRSQRLIAGALSAAADAL